MMLDFGVTLFCRMRVNMKAIAVLIFLCLFPVCRAGELLQRWPGSQHDWRVTAQTTSADGKELAVIITVPGGIFPAAMRLEEPKVQKVTLRLQNIASAEGITFTALKPLLAGQDLVWKEAELEARAHELKTVAGFKVTADKTDLVLEFTDKSLELLRRGGRFQFIDAYRR